MMWYQKRVKIPEGLLSKLTKEQNELRKKIVLKPLPKSIHSVAGCDSAFNGDAITSVFVVFSYPELQEIEVVYETSHVTLPYIPGFLAFREIPNLLLTYEKLQRKPDLLMVDGQGIMHPRRMGIGAHLGVVLQKPTIGVAKSRLTGFFEEPKMEKGNYSIVYDSPLKKEQLGFYLRSKKKVKSIFVSPGHLCDMTGALKLTLNTLTKYKLPEPTRIADKYSKELKMVTV
jgi:deoxyribonuclease V